MACKCDYRELEIVARGLAPYPLDALTGAAKMTDQQSSMQELQSQLEQVDEQLHGVHQEAQRDKFIRLNEQRDALIKRIDRERAQP